MDKSKPTNILGKSDHPGVNDNDEDWKMPKNLLRGRQKVCH